MIYSISGGASPKMAFLSQYITTQYIAQLQHVGADTSGTDVTRVFRLPYSINSRNGEQVKVDVWRTLEYHLEELYSYCTPLESRRKPSKRSKGQLVTLPSQKGLFNLYSLNTARKNDLESLIALRKGEIEKRNVLTYIYAYTVALGVFNNLAQLNKKNIRFYLKTGVSISPHGLANIFHDSYTVYAKTLPKTAVVLIYKILL